MHTHTLPPVDPNYHELCRHFFEPRRATTKCTQHNTPPLPLISSPALVPPSMNISYRQDVENFVACAAGLDEGLAGSTGEFLLFVSYVLYIYSVGEVLWFHD